jgi:hypothetical protein
MNLSCKPGSLALHTHSPRDKRKFLGKLIQKETVHLTVKEITKERIFYLLHAIHGFIETTQQQVGNN